MSCEAFQSASAQLQSATEQGMASASQAMAEAMYGDGYPYLRVRHRFNL